MGQFTKAIEPGGEIYNNQFVNILADAGFPASDIKDVLQEAYEMGTSPEESKRFQKHFRDESGEVDVKKVKAMAHIQNVRMTAESLDALLQERAENTDDELDREELKKTIELMHAQGKTADEIKERIERFIKIAKASTPHPTEHLSPEGIALARQLIEAAEVDAENRDEAITAKLIEIAQSDNFAAYKKADIVDEADNSNTVARIHNTGANALDRELEIMIHEVTGEEVDIDTNTGPKSWDYDADGKPNADGFAMMMKITTTTRGALEDVSTNLETVLQSEINDATRRKLDKLKQEIDKIHSNLGHVHERSRTITQQLAAEGDAEKRWGMYGKFHAEEFEGLFDQLESVYDDVDAKTRGLDFFKEMLQTLDKARKNNDIDANAAMALDESYRTLNRNGIALEKGQTRHNDLVYEDMLDNFFKSKEVLALLNEEDRATIAREGKFSDMGHPDQFAIMETILEHAKDSRKRKELTGILESVNPLEKGKNGYPDQKASYTDRMRLRALFPYKFDEGVISDAGEFGSPRQKFIADLYGIKNMKHMSLNEDKKNLARQGHLPRTFHKNGGKENLDARQKGRDDIEKRIQKALHIMRPASDAERAGGSFTRLQAIDQYRKIVHEAYDMGVPIEVMIGGGQSLNRFGGDVDMPRRILAQELKDILVEKQGGGEKLDDYDRDLMVMASSVLYTEQGRTKRILSATPDQVRDGLMKKVTNILKDLMDLHGEVEDYTFIDQRKRFSDEMQDVQDRAWKAGIEDYSAFNQTYKRDEDGKVTDELVLDGYAGTAAPMETVGHQNNGSRPASGKAASDKQAEVSGFRAIGKDQTLYAMQSFHAGFYGSGNVMKRFKNALDDGKIDQKDINDLMRDADWDEAIFSRNLIDAARFNATHLAEKVFGEEESKNWDHDRLMKLGRDTITMKVPGEDKWYLKSDMAEEQGISEEQMFFAKIYYDRARFLAMTEAALNADPKAGPTLANSEEEILNAIKPDSGLEITLGERTQERWPNVMGQVMEDHQKNGVAYALNNLVDQDIRDRKASGQDMDEINTHYGQGDPGGADSFLRQLGSALRSGTLAHIDKWMGRESIGLENRQHRNMDALIAYNTTMNAKVSTSPDHG